MHTRITLSAVGLMLVSLLTLGTPRQALATPSEQVTSATVGTVQDVGDRRWYRRHVYPYPYYGAEGLDGYYGYGYYRPYRPYAYSTPYYYPPYPYYYRPGFSFFFGY